MKIKRITFSIILIFFILPIFSQSGELDYDFGFGGKTTFDMGSTSEEAFVLQLQDDGKIVVAGSIHESPDVSFAVMRFLSNGDPDLTFGGSGFVETFIDGGNSTINAMAIQSDGKIVVAGNYKYSFVYDIVLARYNSDGSLDESFGDNGIVISDLLTDYDKAYGIIMLSDGKILVAGCIDGQYGEDFVLIRYNSDGTLDETFGEEGIVITDFEGYYYDIAYDLELQNDGKIIVGGVTANAYYEYFALARYKTNGELDVTFGEEGKVIAETGTQDNHLSDIEIQEDGKIVAAGFSYLNGSYQENFSLARFNINGTLDESFGEGGWATTPETYSTDEILSIAIQQSGRIVATGYYEDASNKNFTLLQYNSNGTLNESFGEEGIVSTDFDERDETAYAIIIQPDNKILVAGNSVLEDESDANIVLARYMGDFGLNVEENIFPPSFNIYPNPFTNEITITDQYNIFADHHAELIILDVIGNKVFYQMISGPEIIFNLGFLVPGMYLIQIRSEINTYNQTIIKQN